jgi:N-acetylglucosamine kinase-like BadF-type ATPase
VFLGIDIGGSKTECVVGDAGRVLGSARESSAKLGRVSDTSARQALQAVVSRACRVARVEPRAIERGCVGTSGASNANVRALIRSALQEVIPGEIVVVPDMHIAHHAAFEGGPGVVVISGTGSVAYGVNPQGATARAGGWGAPISDEGSGDWIGRTAVSDVLVAHDSAEHSGLLHHLCDAWHVSSPAELARVANASPPPDFASLFPEVLASDQAGDRLARDVLVRAAHELSQLAMIVVRRLWPSPATIGIAMTGGVFTHSATVREVFTHILATVRPEAVVTQSSHSAAEGALMMARSAVKSAHS